MFARRSVVGVACGLGLLAAGPAAACPFCSTQGQTLSGEVGQADFIVLGTLTNAQRDPADFTKGTTDLVVDTVVKPHDYLKGKATLRIPRYVPPDPAAKGTKYLVFCSLYTRPADLPAAAVGSAAVLANPAGAQLDAYRGEPVGPDSKLAEYLKGAIEVRGKDPVARLRYFFDYLDSPDLVISGDALNEFGSADYKEVRELSQGLPADKVLRWLKDPATPPARLGLYGLFAGHCGKKEDAKAVREVLDNPDKALSSGLDGVLAAYILLDREAGWDYLVKLLGDPGKEFPVRYAGLKVLRFFWEFRPDVVPPNRVLDGVKVLAGQADLADLPIEDLRKWGRWDQTGTVLKVGAEPGHKAIPIVRRAVLRFALSAAPHSPDAARYVDQARKEDPERVKLVEELLKDEPPTKTDKDKGTATPTAPAQSQPAGGSR